MGSFQKFVFSLNASMDYCMTNSVQVVMFWVKQGQCFSYNSFVMLNIIKPSYCQDLNFNSPHFLKNLFVFSSPFCLNSSDTLGRNSFVVTPWSGRVLEAMQDGQLKYLRSCVHYASKIELGEIWLKSWQVDKFEYYTSWLLIKINLKKTPLDLI